MIGKRPDLLGRVCAKIYTVTRFMYHHHKNSEIDVRCEDHLRYVDGRERLVLPGSSFCRHVDRRRHITNRAMPLLTWRGHRTSRQVEMGSDVMTNIREMSKGKVITAWYLGR